MVGGTVTHCTGAWRRGEGALDEDEIERGVRVDVAEAIALSCAYLTSWISISTTTRKMPAAAAAITNTILASPSLPIAFCLFIFFFFYKENNQKEIYVNKLDLGSRKPLVPIFWIM